MLSDHVSAHILQALAEERRGALAFALTASQDDHAERLARAIALTKHELGKAIRKEYSVYGRALREFKKVVVLTSSGKRISFGGNSESETWAQVAEAARSGLTQICEWALWRQQSLDILGTEDPVGRSLLLSVASKAQPDTQRSFFRSSVGRLFDVKADIELAKRAAASATRPGPEVLDLTGLDDIADATATSLVAQNVTNLDAVVAEMMEVLEEAQQVSDTTATVEVSTEVEASV